MFTAKLLGYFLCDLNSLVSVLASSVGDREFESRSGQTKDYKIGIACFSAKHASLRREREQRLVGSESG